MNLLFATSLGLFTITEHMVTAKALVTAAMHDNSTGVADTPAATVSLVDIGARCRYGT